MRRYLLLLTLAALFETGAQAAPKTDVVVLANGDHVTGEVKELAQGKLTYKTDDAGTLYIEWDKIVSLESRQRLQVKLSSGDWLVGSASVTTSPRQLQLTDSHTGTSVILLLDDIVYLHPIDEGKRLDLFDGYVTAGYSLTKAYSLQEFAFTGGLSTTNEKRRWSVDAATAVTTQDGANDTQRFDVTGQRRRFLPRQWFWQATVRFESNDELGLVLRTSAGAAFGQYLFQSNEHEWAWYAGANLTQERPIQQPNTHDVEALFGTQYAYFHYDTPERTAYVDLQLLPSLTDAGRVRAAATGRCRYEIVKDFFFELSVFASYDNRPGADAKSNSDYGTETSLGFTF